jgi:hypothetical protein
VAAIISEYGMARPVPNAREKWKKQEKRSFGHDTDKTINSDEKNRERLRAEGLATYAKRNGLEVTLYQDYGWPAKKLEK